MRQTTRSHCLLFGIFTIICTALGAGGWAIGAPQSRPPIATMHAESDGMSWTPHVPYERLVLTVNLPGEEVIRQEFPSGTWPFLSGPLADGQYTYELQVVPIVDPKTREALRQARASGDMSIVKRLREAGALPQGPQVQSGYFLIKRGVWVQRSNVPEPPPRR